MEDETSTKCDGVTLLEKCPKELLEKFVHEVLDGICDGREPRYVTYGKSWSAAEWRLVTQHVGELLKSFVRKDLKKNEIVQELDKHSLDAETKQTLCSCFTSRQDELRAAFINSTAGITNAYLKDFDWKVKISHIITDSSQILKNILHAFEAGVEKQELQNEVIPVLQIDMVLASDKIASIRKPIVSVDFDINQGNSVKPVTVEMTKEELKNLITSLEAANKMVVQLKG